MSRLIKYTLLADGSSDRMLLPIINWVLTRIPLLQDCRLIQQFAEPTAIPVKSAGLPGKVAASAEHYPCDLLFIHRDSEKEDRGNRIQEIHETMALYPDLPFVCVTPVRMSETWLLIDADAIRRAADNPCSQAVIELPRLRDLEEVADPKRLLQELLIQASEFKGRRREKFRRDLAWRRQRVAEFIPDFSVLSQLPAFAAFHQETVCAVEKLLAEET